MRGVALAGLLLACAASARSPSPTPDCLDARAIERVHAVDENTLAIDAGNGWFALAHASGCDVEDKAKLLAHEGWVCGREQEFVQVGDTLCPVLSATRIDGRTYAGLAIAADRRRYSLTENGTPSLEPIEVQARTRRRAGFRGDSSYCFSPAAVHGWSADGNELVVQTAPRRSGGNRRYRVELAGSCPELTWADAVEFHSGVGVGMICGHAGDRAVPVFDAVALGIDDRVPLRNEARGCNIAAVYPEE